MFGYESDPNQLVLVADLELLWTHRKKKNNK